MDNSSVYTENLNVKPEVNRRIVREGFEDRKTGIAAFTTAVLQGLWMACVLMFSKVGVNWFVFVMIATAGILYIMYREKNLNIKHAVFWLAAIGVYASVFFRQTFLLPPTFLLLPSVVVLMTIYAAKDIRQNIVGQFLYRHFAFIAHFWNIFLLKFGNGEEDGKKGNFVKILLGVVVAGLLLVIIIPLMFSADMMFEKVMEKFFEIEDIGKVIGRIVVGLIIVLTSFAFMFTITVKKNNPLKRKTQSTQRNFSATIITVLVVIAAVFALFIIIQARYLIFNAGGLPKGVTPMEYAVGGYWEQAWLTAINTAVVLFALWLSGNAQGKAKRAINILLTTMVGLNVYLVLSAAYKMRLYEQTFGFTPKRALVYLILLFELIALALLIYKIFKRDFNFIKTVVYLGVAYFALVSMVNFQAFSVSQNIQRYKKTGEIDTHFLYSQGADAGKVINAFYFKNKDALSQAQVNDVLGSFSYDYWSWSWDDDPATLEAFDKANKPDDLLAYNIARVQSYKYGRQVYIDAQNNK